MEAVQIIVLGIGVLAAAGGTWALWSPDEARRFSRGLPRNEKIGRILIFIDMAWSLYLFHQMNLGDWNTVKPLVYFTSPLIYWFIIRHVNHYLGARGLGWFLILAAKPVVNLCFISTNPLTLPVTVLAYLWVVLGICIFSVPHWLRDWIAFWEADSKRWSWGCRAKIATGFCLIILSLFVH